jgi:hypothetical protein
MDQETDQLPPDKAWQPLKLLQRFRARVSALTNWETSLPINREVEEANLTTAPDPALDAYTCDIACVCMDATPAQRLLAQRLEQSQSSAERHTLSEVHQRLQAIYSLDGASPQRHQIHKMVVEAAIAQDLPADRAASIQEFVAGPINDAFCREQAVAWLADSGHRLHLYGHCWEEHPELLPFVHHFSGSPDELQIIQRGAKVNLRLTPCPADDPILASGMRHGAFFLMRFFPEDVIERIYQPLHEFCQQHNITNDQQLIATATPAVARLLHFAQITLNASVFEVHSHFVEELDRCAQHNFTQWPGSLWDEYDAVTFSSKQELLELLNVYLADAPDRRRIAGAMRRKFVEKSDGNTDVTGAEAPPVDTVSTAGEVAA